VTTCELDKYQIYLGGEGQFPKMAASNISLAVTQSARSRRSHGEKGECEQPTIAVGNAPVVAPKPIFSNPNGVLELKTQDAPISDWFSLPDLPLYLLVRITRTTFTLLSVVVENPATLYIKQLSGSHCCLNLQEMGLPGTH